MNSIKTGHYEMPTWARLVYKAAEKWDRFFSDMATKAHWRYEFWDSFCYCEHCLKRRAEGRQAPAWKPWWLGGRV